MSWMSSIITWLKSCEDYFYDIYLKIYDWAWPFWLAANLFLLVSRALGYLAYYFSLFNNWLVWAADELSDILSWDYIKSLIKSWLPQLENTVSWFLDWWNKVTSAITSWWSATSTTVKGWISTAVQPFNAMLTAWSNFWNNTWPQFTAGFNTLKANWDHFWTVLFPSLVDFTWLGTWWQSRLAEVNKLVNDKLKVWFPFYDDFIKVWASIALFFTDPVEYIWQRFADWFLGPEG